MVRKWKWSLLTYWPYTVAFGGFLFQWVFDKGSGIERLFIGSTIGFRWGFVLLLPTVYRGSVRAAQSSGALLSILRRVV